MPRRPAKPKQPKKRPRQAARKRSTAKDHDQHVEYAVFRLRTRFYPSEILKDLSRRFELAPGAAQNVLDQAQARIREAVEDLTGQPQLPAALLFYQQVIRDDSARWQCKVMAQTRIDRLLGLDKIGLGDEAKDQLIVALLEELKKPPPPEIPEDSP